jgi:hypothetical protein
VASTTTYIDPTSVAALAPWPAVRAGPEMSGARCKEKKGPLYTNSYRSFLYFNSKLLTQILFLFSNTNYLWSYC